ncbi:MAG: cobalamin-independent methionine synthase II family protein [Planctomycetales bacterium]|nr:cobalamin-independent methionine synthase II family protein [Planctomycetales bacterium]
MTEARRGDTATRGRSDERESPATLRADVVGSLLRPRALLEARERRVRGECSERELRLVEDRAVAEAVAMQERCGLPVVTDGELRRTSFQSALVEAVEGFGEAGLPAYLWGWWRDEEGEHRVERPPTMGAVGNLRRRRAFAVPEFEDLRRRTTQVPKVTLPSPTLFEDFWDPGRSREAYPTLEAFLQDVTRILCEEAAALERAGARYLQLDAPHYTVWLDAHWRGLYQRAGWTLSRFLSLAVELDNAVMAAAPGVTWGFHLCRGNQGGRWLVEGGYEVLAKMVFPRIRAHRLLLEYDDPRSGSFEPLRETPDGTTVVLGLVSTKRPEPERRDALVARLREAARILPMDRLALSPQCGFSPSVAGGPLTPEQQEGKLRLVATVAREVWG